MSALRASILHTPSRTMMLSSARNTVITAASPTVASCRLSARTVFTSVNHRQLHQGVAIDVRGLGHGQLAVRDGTHRRRALAALEHRTFAEHRSGAELGDLVAVDL